MSLEEYTHMIMPFKNKLYRQSLRILGNMAEAEDVVQEVLIKLWKNKDELEKYNSVEALCMRMTRNLSIDKLRSKHKRVEALPEYADFESKDSSPYRKAELKDTVDQVKKMVAQLPEKQRLVFQLRDMDGLTYQEIADTLEISMQQVKVYIFRARKKIRLQLLNAQSYGL